MGEWRVGRAGPWVAIGCRKCHGGCRDRPISKALRKRRKAGLHQEAGSVSLRDYDEKDRKVQESFGGAETVTLLGEESDSDADVDF